MFVLLRDHSSDFLCLQRTIEVLILETESAIFRFRPVLGVNLFLAVKTVYDVIAFVTSYGNLLTFYDVIYSFFSVYYYYYYYYYYY